MSQYYYYCELCDHGSQQKSHNDAHIKSNLHIQKCNIYKCNVLEKTDLVSLLNNYKVPLNGTIHDIYDNILSQKSQLKITKEDLINKQTNFKKISMENQIPIYLCHELTQFTKGKTEQTLN